MAAFTYEALAAAPAGWTSPEFESRESKFDELVNAGSIHNRLRAFDWAREEIAPAESIGSRAGNQAGRAARKETVQRGASPFTGYAKGSPGLPGVTPAVNVQPSAQTFGSDPSVWNLYPYVSSNPLTRTDPDGRSGTVVGGVAGGLVGGLWELGRQAISGEDINWRKVAGSAARGAVVGAMMGSVIDTGGASLPVLLGAGALSNVAGGEAERLITGEKTTFEHVTNDVAGGLVIGLGAGLVPPVRPYAGAVPATRGVSAVRKLTATADEGSLTLADDTATGVARTSRVVEVRLDVSVGRFRNQPGYAQDEISGRWYNIAKRERAFEQRISVHGNLRTSESEATLYAKFDKEGNFLKWGITEDPATRYGSTELRGGFLTRYRRGPRSTMLDRERRLVERFPGPENKEPWAGWSNPSHTNYRLKPILSGVEE